jgi:hypothetical protein
MTSMMGGRVPALVMWLPHPPTAGQGCSMGRPAQMRPSFPHISHLTVVPFGEQRFSLAGFLTARLAAGLFAAAAWLPLRPPLLPPSPPSSRPASAARRLGGIVFPAGGAACAGQSALGSEHAQRLRRSPLLMEVAIAGEARRCRPVAP